MGNILRSKGFLLGLTLLVVAGLVWIGAHQSRAGRSPEQQSTPPWVVETLADGSTRALGLVPARSTLQDALTLYGRRVEAALFQGGDGVLNAEAYYAEIVAGGISGRLVLSLDLSESVLNAVRERAASRRMLETGVVRYDVNPLDGDTLLAAPISLVTFVPSANLEEATVAQRFGAPRERLPAEGGEPVHLLYPDRGIAITVSRRGREMLLYSHPAAFEGLRARLLATATP